LGRSTNNSANGRLGPEAPPPARRAKLTPLRKQPRGHAIYVDRDSYGQRRSHESHPSARQLWPPRETHGSAEPLKRVSLGFSSAEAHERNSLRRNPGGSASPATTTSQVRAAAARSGAFHDRAGRPFPRGHRGVPGLRLGPDACPSESIGNTCPHSLFVEMLAADFRGRDVASAAPGRHGRQAEAIPSRARRSSALRGRCRGQGGRRSRVLPMP
jgi:hypothetical protein